MWADPGSAQTSGLGKMGLDTVVPGGPTAPDPLQYPGWSPDSLVPLGEALGAAAGPPSTFLSRVRVCVRVCLCVCGPVSPRVASRGSRLRHRLARVLSTARRRGPFRSHSSSQLGCGAQDVFTSGLMDTSCSQLPFVGRKFVLILWDIFSYCL